MTNPDEDPDTTIDAWAESEAARLKVFMAWWRAGQRGDDPDIPAEHFPETMQLSNWDEMHRSWGGA